VEGLFIETGVFKGLLPLENPSVLSLKPSELYAKIRTVAKVRYGLELPEMQTELKCLSHAINKLALIRDICLKLGVRLLSHANKDYVLENDIQAVLS
jgi:hypothetical protein